MCNSIFAFYRDVVEGGKPQFLFYHKVKQSSAEVRMTFAEGVKDDKKNKRGTFLTDGKELIFIPRKELTQLILTSGSLTRKDGKRQKKYRMMPSSVASVQMLKEFFEK